IHIVSKRTEFFFRVVLRQWTEELSKIFNLSPNRFLAYSFLLFLFHAVKNTSIHGRTKDCLICQRCKLVHLADATVHCNTERMNHHENSRAQEEKRGRAKPIASAVLSDGSIVEMLYRPNEARTVFCVSKDGSSRHESKLTDQGETLIPYSAKNN